jgi:hypothetical protein
MAKPCVCQGSNENCMYCSGRGYVRGNGGQQFRTTRANESGIDGPVREFSAKHPLLNPNPLQQPEGSEAKYRPHPSNETGLEPEPQEFDRNVASSASINIRAGHQRPNKRGSPPLDVINVAKEIATSTCPSCRVRFPYYIDLVAHQQAGCPKPSLPIQQNRYIPLKRSHLSRKTSIHTPSGMTKCSCCGCPVKATRLKRHLGRCPKSSAGHAKTCTKWNVQRPKSGKIPDQKTYHSAADAKRPDPRMRFAQVNGVEPIDATKLYAHSFRENGKYGSHPLHDGMDDESGPE